MEGRVALLKLTPHDCGRVAVGINFDQRCTGGVLGIFHDLEEHGYQLPHLRTAWFHQVGQSSERCPDASRESRRFEERSGTRAA